MLPSTTSSQQVHFLESGISAEGGISPTLNHSIEPVGHPVVLGGITSSEESPDFGEVWNLSRVTGLGIVPDGQLEKVPELQGLRSGETHWSIAGIFHSKSRRVAAALAIGPCTLLHLPFASKSAAFSCQTLAMESL